MWLALLKPFWKQLAIAALALGAYLYGYYNGYSNEKAKCEAFKAEVTATAKVQAQKNAETVLKQQKITESTKQGYEDAIANLKSYYAKHPTTRWVSKSCGTNHVSEVSRTAKSADGEASSDQVSASGSDAVTPEMCAADVLQLLYLQKWVREQVEAN